jgi:pSer/pThr/pTyr-binding forkhead associated (FHA) protein
MIMRKICIMSKKNEPRFVELNRRITYVGRSTINDLQIKDKYVSREHLLLRKFENKLFVMDLKSENGTFLNGNQIRHGTEVEVKEGDSIVVGMSVICQQQKSSDEALALIRSAYSSKKHGVTDTLAAKTSGFQPVNHKPNNLESNQRLDA